MPTPDQKCYAARVAEYRVTQRPSRVKEAAIEYAPAVPNRSAQAPAIYHVTVTDRGRLVLPAEIRARLKICDGDRVAVTIEEDGTISMTTQDVAIGQLRGMFRHLAPTDHFASDDIIAERRREARMDDRRNREWGGRKRQIKKRR